MTALEAKRAADNFNQDLYNLQKEIKKQFGEKGFHVRFENDREIIMIFVG